VSTDEVAADEVAADEVAVAADELPDTTTAGTAQTLVPA